MALMQRSTELPPAPLLVPVESRRAYRRRKARLRVLDALLLMVEQHNWDRDPEADVPAHWVEWAFQLGCLVPAVRGVPMNGATLHARLLRRQEALMLPVFTVHHGRTVRVHDSANGGEGYTPELRTDLRAIA